MSCNYLAPRAIEVKNSDTLSEVSESGTATSGFNSNWGSREELRDFVAKHGLKDISDLYQDRFRVDRKKLEQMLSGECTLGLGWFFDGVFSRGQRCAYPRRRLLREDYGRH